MKWLLMLLFVAFVALVLFSSKLWVTMLVGVAAVPVAFIVAKRGSKGGRDHF
jgi:hypothetical protein